MYHTTCATQTVALVSQPLHVLTGGFRTNGLPAGGQGAFKLCMCGETGHVYQVLASTNLSTTNWVVIGAMEGTNGGWRFLDMGATNRPRRFYHTTCTTLHPDAAFLWRMAPPPAPAIPP